MSRLATSGTPAARFKHDARITTDDPELRRILGKTLTTYRRKVDDAGDRWTDWQAVRAQARAWKYDAVGRLDQLLLTLEKNLENRGVEVHWARNAQEARDVTASLVERYNVRSVVKSKSMTTEEIELNAFLEDRGLEVIESDLGEYIVQLRNEKPFHIVTPAMHLTQPMISRLFEEKLGIPYTDSAEELTLVARRQLRRKFLEADMGITGANFAIADPGVISITENEGNGVLSASGPRVHVAYMGIEKVLPSLEQLALFLPLLAHSGTGQDLTCYNTWYGGPRQDGEVEGPEAMHLVLLDNGRSAVVADPEQRESLHCIRCGACLNACPIFRHIGGHAYGTVYQGPIGSVITPNLRGLREYGHLSFASSLCGRCTDVCPVHINLHHHLLENRRNQVMVHRLRPLERRAFAQFARVMRAPRRYRRAVRFTLFGLRLLHRFPFLQKLPGLRNWTDSRALVPAPTQSFLESVEQEQSK